MKLRMIGAVAALVLAVGAGAAYASTAHHGAGGHGAAEVLHAGRHAAEHPQGDDHRVVRGRDAAPAPDRADDHAAASVNDDPAGHDQADDRGGASGSDDPAGHDQTDDRGRGGDRQSDSSHDGSGDDRSGRDG